MAAPLPAPPRIRPADRLGSWRAATARNESQRCLAASDEHAGGDPPVSYGEIADELWMSAQQQRTDQLQNPDFRYQSRKWGSPLRREASLVTALGHQILSVQRGMRR